MASDVQSAYSPTVNPNEGWSFGYRTTILGTGFTLFDASSTLSGNAGGELSKWSTSTPPFAYLGAYKNLSTTTAFDGGEGTVVQAGEFLMHPEGSAVAIARYTVATSGMYDIAYATAHLGGSNGLGAHFSLFTDNVFQRGENVSPSGSYAYSPVVGQSSYLTAGSFVDFVVDNGGNGDDWDSTGLRASVTAVPGPGALAVFGLGLVGRLRRKRA